MAILCFSTADEDRYAQEQYENPEVQTDSQHNTIQMERLAAGFWRVRLLASLCENPSSRSEAEWKPKPR
jgi:hypothetical protein